MARPTNSWRPWINSWTAHLWRTLCTPKQRNSHSGSCMDGCTGRPASGSRWKSAACGDLSAIPCHSAYSDPALLPAAAPGQPKVHAGTGKMPGGHPRNTRAMLASRRCGARTRAGTPCISRGGKKRCRMRGGTPVRARRAATRTPWSTGSIRGQRSTSCGSCRIWCGNRARLVQEIGLAKANDRARGNLSEFRWVDHGWAGMRRQLSP